MYKLSYIHVCTELRIISVDSLLSSFASTTMQKTTLDHVFGVTEVDDFIDRPLYLHPNKLHVIKQVNARLVYLVASRNAQYTHATGQPWILGIL